MWRRLKPAPAWRVSFSVSALVAEAGTTRKQKEMIDIVSVLNRLACQRPIFHSEADLQHALAWEIHQRLPNAAIRLEYPISHLDQQLHLDIWIVQPNAVLPIELKYKTRALNIGVGTERFGLKNQSAQDIGRYDFIKDIRRLEQVLTKQKNSVGYAILLTNDSAYWKTPGSNRTVDADFRLHNGRTLEGTLGWQGAGAGTTRGRESPIVLQAQYPLQWQDYSELSATSYGKFRCLVVRVG